jgi:hypothetical protein
MQNYKNINKVISTEGCYKNFELELAIFCSAINEVIFYQTLFQRYAKVGVQ